MTKQEHQQEVPRRWAKFDSIAQARRQSRVSELRRELQMAERGFASAFGPGGQPPDPVQQGQVADAIAAKREHIEALLAMSGDRLAETFASDAIQLQEYGSAPTLRDTLARGRQGGVSGPPGMP